MNIGTAKATVEELEMIPHHCLDVLNISEPGNIQRYQELAQNAVEDIISRGKMVLVSGGSGFYLKSFLEPVVDEVEIPEELREEVETLYSQKGLDAVVDELLQLNPEGVGKLDLQNPRRVLRALERCRSSGRSVPELQLQMKQLPIPFPDLLKKICLLTRSDDALKSRISKRTSEMLDNGLISEVETLLKNGLRENPLANSAIGYREVIAYLDGIIKTMEELMATISQNTWQLVRKQKKWFRTQLPNANVVNLDINPDPNLSDIFDG
jgi:tRNA dimethylallyltransferase